MLHKKFSKHTVYLSLGSNLGNKKQNLLRSIKLLKSKFEIKKISPFMITEPLHIINQPKFLNAVFKGKTNLAPFALLRFIKNLEQKMGRTKTIRFGPRLIDIDILYYDNLHLNTERLVIPHPRIQERKFIKILLEKLNKKPPSYSVKNKLNFFGIHNFTSNS